MRALLRLTALLMLLSLALAPGSGASALIISAEIIAEDLADTAEWLITGVEQGGKYGYAVAAGDFDGDGDDDVLVSGPRVERDVYREGVVFLYKGGLGGLETSPSWSMGGGLQGGYYGSAVASAGLRRLQRQARSTEVARRARIGLSSKKFCRSSAICPADP